MIDFFIIIMNSVELSAKVLSEMLHQLIFWEFASVHHRDIKPFD